MPKRLKMKNVIRVKKERSIMIDNSSSGHNKKMYVANVLIHEEQSDRTA